MTFTKLLLQTYYIKVIEKTQRTENRIGIKVTIEFLTGNIRFFFFRLETQQNCLRR